MITASYHAFALVCVCSDENGPPPTGSICCSSLFIILFNSSCSFCSTSCLDSVCGSSSLWYGIRFTWNKCEQRRRCISSTACHRKSWRNKQNVCHLVSVMTNGIGSSHSLYATEHVVNFLHIKWCVENVDDVTQSGFVISSLIICQYTKNNQTADIRCWTMLWNGSALSCEVVWADRGTGSPQTKWCQGNGTNTLFVVQLCVAQSKNSNLASVWWTSVCRPAWCHKKLVVRKHDSRQIWSFKSQWCFLNCDKRLHMRIPTR